MDQKIDSSGQRLDQKIDRVASEVIKLQERAQRIEETMATKDDINRVFNVLDDLAGQFKEFRQERVGESPTRS